ncbi:MAG: 3-isopropylmalate dehydratase [Propionibacteriales bacterium]|nr:3-isopropylmalate dehydratase [Propionibacteriales bacterium]
MSGRAQRFGDNVNTDYIIAAQHKAASLDVREMATHTFADIDPDFVSRVEPGDIVVAGRNFGCGSSRETAVHVLQALGVGAVLAQSFARIYFRNAINSGLPVFECDTSGIVQGDQLEIDQGRGIATNTSQGERLPITPLPPVMQAVLDAGGIVAYLRQHPDLTLPDLTAPGSTRADQPTTDTHPRGAVR